MTFSTMSTWMWLCASSARLSVDSETRIIMSPVSSGPPGTTMEKRLRSTTSATVSPIMRTSAAPPTSIAARLGQTIARRMAFADVSRIVEIGPPIVANGSPWLTPT